MHHFWTISLLSTGYENSSLVSCSLLVCKPDFDLINATNLKSGIKTTHVLVFLFCFFLLQWIQQQTLMYFLFCLQLSKCFGQCSDKKVNVNYSEKQWSRMLMNIWEPYSQLWLLPREFPQRCDFTYLWFFTSVLNVSCDCYCVKKCQK